MEYLVAAREVGDSLLSVCELRGFSDRTLRVLYSSYLIGNLGFRSAPPPGFMLLPRFAGKIHELSFLLEIFHQLMQNTGRLNYLFV